MSKEKKLLAELKKSYAQMKEMGANNAILDALKKQIQDLSDSANATQLTDIQGDVNTGGGDFVERDKITIIQNHSNEKLDAYTYFQATPPDMRNIFNSYIRGKTKDFVGREFVFSTINEFIKNNTSGYLVIRGDPGIGKSALLAKMILDNGYIHHFNIALQNIRSVETFIENICLQLIERYELPITIWPEDATRSSGFLTSCLQKASAKRQNEPVVIAIDALDEVDTTGLSPEVNALYLPYSLPDGVFVVLTVRRLVDLRLQTETMQFLDLEADGDGNIRDIKTYIENYYEKSNIASVVETWQVSKLDFIEDLAKKSQGNFMYLYHVLPAIEKGSFKDGGLEELPYGLVAYYQRHWRQMREGNEAEFEGLFEPIICILGVAQEPVSIETISNWTGLGTGQVRKAIEMWYEFLRDIFENGQYLYRIYHVSFQDFLKDKVDLTRYDGMIADYYLQQLNLE